MTKVANAERKHIVFAGKRNAGKSSLVNAFLGQDLLIVSDVPGTTTDPVKKAMELLPYGPVVLVDTAGIDDVGELGQKRIGKSTKAISEADFIIVVVDAQNELDNYDSDLILHIKKLDIPFAVVINKIDLGINQSLRDQLNSMAVRFFEVSGKNNTGIDELKRKITRLMPNEIEPSLIGDLVKQQDVVVLVVPIDLGAPKGRLIMPQVQTIREALDEDTIVVVVKDKELRSALDRLKDKPKLIITDSQAIMRVAADVPDEIPLTTFSILMARYKGDLPEFVSGIKKIDELENGDKVLIAEACTHHAQEDDIGRVKIPRWLRLHTKKDLQIDYVNGADYPQNIGEYKIIIHCGSCMLTRKAMQVRIKQSKLVDIPIINYGMVISYMHGAIPRAIEPFDEAMLVWSKQ